MREIARGYCTRLKVETVRSDGVCDAQACSLLKLSRITYTLLCREGNWGSLGSLRENADMLSATIALWG